MNIFLSLEKKFNIVSNLIYSKNKKLTFFNKFKQHCLFTQSLSYTNMKNQIVYTRTDEAPLLASYSLVPILRCFLKKANVKVITKDISLAARILAQFPDFLTSSQFVEDDLNDLSRLIQSPDSIVYKITKYICCFTSAFICYQRTSI